MDFLQKNIYFPILIQQSEFWRVCQFEVHAYCVGFFTGLERWDGWSDEFADLFLLDEKVHSDQNDTKEGAEHWNDGVDQLTFDDVT